MDLTPELRKEIDEMSIESMLRRWRYAVAGTAMFQGESGKYFSDVMTKKRNANNSEWVRASKHIG